MTKILPPDYQQFNSDATSVTVPGTGDVPLAGSPADFDYIELTEPAAFVEKALLLKNWAVVADGSFDGSDYTFKSIATDLELEHKRQIHTYNKTAPTRGRLQPFHHTLILRTLELLQEKAKIAELENLRASLKCEQENLQPIRDLVKAMCGKSDETMAAVLAHTLQNIKRSINKLETRREMFVVFFGAQGGGKSQALKQLFMPIKNSTVYMAIQEATDPRFHAPLAKSVLVLSEELPGMNKADASKLKNLITAETLSYRPLGTNSAQTVPRRATFIGTTNRQLDQLHSDDTGMRRFFQITCSEKLDWEMVNSLTKGEPLLNLWRGIDLYTDYRSGHEDAIGSHQRGLTTQNPLAEFLDDCGLVPTQDLSQIGYRIALEDLYAFFQEWSKQTKTAENWNRNYFARCLKGSAGNERASRKGTKHTIYFFSKASIPTEHLAIWENLSRKLEGKSLLNEGMKANDTYVFN